MPSLFRALLVFALVQTIASAQRAHVLPLQLGSPVVGEPCSATRTLDYEPAANSSDPVAVHAEERLFRDSEGRTRSEIKYPNQLLTVDIIDFVAHVHYRWTPGDTVVSSYKIKDAPAATTSATPEKLPEDAPRIEGIPTRHNHWVTGTETIEGSNDTWYAPDLHLALLTTVDRPGIGKTTYRFVNISRAEPDPSLFRVPADMKLQDDTPPPPVKPSAVAADDFTPSNSVGDSAAAVARNAPAYASDPKFQKALALAKEKKSFPADEWLARWKNASKIAKGQCVECLHHMIVFQMELLQWKDAINTADQLEAIAAAPNEKFFAQSQRGAALMQTNNGEPKPEQLKEAEASLHSALAMIPGDTTVIWAEGRALAMLGRDDEAKQMFQKYLDLAKMSDIYRTRAEHFIESPRLASMRMAPAFTLITSEGEQMSLDDMGGKVVLLDFWATWCGPCKESLPEIQRIAKKFADQPLVVISISSDRDESAWRTFIQKNNMTWPQYRDANGALSRTYGVDAIPHYFSIDTDGVLQNVQVGSGADVEGDVRKLLNKAHDAEKKKAKESDRAAAGD
jgi:peroxiredoxin